MYILFECSVIFMLFCAFVLYSQIRSLSYKKKASEYFDKFINKKDTSDEDVDLAYNLFRSYTSYLILVLYPLAAFAMIFFLFKTNNENRKTKRISDKDFCNMKTMLWLYVICRHPIGSFVSFVVTLVFLLAYLIIAYLAFFISSVIVGRCLINPNAKLNFVNHHYGKFSF
nr:MAG TPA: hypothetical protein [Caudoviricetes sp.]